MTAPMLVASAGDWGVPEWLIVVAPFAFYYACILALLASGSTDGRKPASVIREPFRMIGVSLERVTGMPAWAAAGVLSGLLVLLVAFIGLYWDVAWHIDYGRDRILLTPPHTMIVLGLGGLVYAAVVATIFASIDGGADVGLRVGRVRIPWSALALGALGAGGLAAFPLDAMWHAAYGLDVTLWSPTHLQLVGGGGLATLALWLMVAEGRGASRPTALGGAIHATVAGATLVALSAFQGEFDFGVPQFQVLYLPILIAIAAGFSLVVARIALGPGGALKACLVFLILRGGAALLVAGALGHTVPRFPLYVGAAICVEVVALLAGVERRLRFALLAGATVGSIGVAAEWLTVQLWGIQGTTGPASWQPLVFGVVAASGAALAGAGFGQAFDRVRTAVPWGALALGGMAVVAALVYPLPRNVGDVTATVHLTDIGSTAHLEVDLNPPDAARDATAFGVMAWQGGGTVPTRLDEVSPGHYVAANPVPVIGAWKTVIGLQRGDEVMAAPVYLPPDPSIGAAAIPAQPVRQAAFVRNTDLLLRESHGGPFVPAAVVYMELVMLVAVWAALLAVAVIRPGSESRRDPGPRPRAPHPRPVAAG